MNADPTPLSIILKSENRQIQDMLFIRFIQDMGIQFLMNRKNQQLIIQYHQNNHPAPLIV